MLPYINVANLMCFILWSSYLTLYNHFARLNRELMTHFQFRAKALVNIVYLLITSLASSYLHGLLPKNHVHIVLAICLTTNHLRLNACTHTRNSYSENYTHRLRLDSIVSTFICININNDIHIAKNTKRYVLSLVPPPPPPVNIRHTVSLF